MFPKKLHRVVPHNCPPGNTPVLTASKIPCFCRVLQMWLRDITTGNHPFSSFRVRGLLCRAPPPTHMFDKRVPNLRFFSIVVLHLCPLVHMLKWKNVFQKFITAQMGTVRGGPRRKNWHKPRKSRKKLQESGCKNRLFGRFSPRSAAHSLAKVRWAHTQRGAPSRPSFYAA